MASRAREAASLRRPASEEQRPAVPSRAREAASLRRPASEERRPAVASRAREAASLRRPDLKQKRLPAASRAWPTVTLRWSALVAVLAMLVLPQVAVVQPWPGALAHPCEPPWGSHTCTGRTTPRSYRSDSCHTRLHRPWPTPITSSTACGPRRKVRSAWARCLVRSPPPRRHGPELRPVDDERPCAHCAHVSLLSTKPLRRSLSVATSGRSVGSICRHAAACSA